MVSSKHSEPFFFEQSLRTHTYYCYMPSIPSCIINHITNTNTKQSPFHLFFFQAKKMQNYCIIAMTSNLDIKQKKSTNFQSTSSSNANNCEMSASQSFHQKGKIGSKSRLLPSSRTNGHGQIWHKFLMHTGKNN